jgi:drug/metabolite transporter (DMT)-like permease
MTNMSNNLRGALLMMGSMAAFTFNDASMKALSDEMPLAQAVFLRGIATTALLVLLTWRMGGLRLGFGRRDWVLVALRTVAEIASAYFFISALFNMPIANATAILQALPLSVTLAGSLFLGEAVGWRRLSAIMVGFIGVMLIVQPGAAGFNTYSLDAVLAVAFVTVRDLASRQLSVQVPSLMVALIASVAVTLSFGAAALSQPWAMPSSLAWGQLAAASVFIIGGYVFSVMTMRTGEIGAITPFRYTSLLWALLLGLVLFGEWPDRLTLAGAFIVVATGIFTLMRERRLARRTAPPGLRQR